VQVLYVSADDLDTLTKLEKGNRAGSAAAVASFSCQGGCKRKKLLEYFGQRRWVMIIIEAALKPREPRSAGTRPGLCSQELTNVLTVKAQACC
jgi:hypothetical protein